MKKIFLNTVRILLVLSCAFFWTSCEEDEGGKEGNDALVGTWSFTDGEEETVLTLNNNKTFSVTYKKNGVETAKDEGQWTFNDPQLLLNLDDGDFTFEYTVVSAGSSLVLEDSEGTLITFDKKSSSNPGGNGQGNSGIVGTWSPTTLRLVVPALGFDETMSAAEAGIFSSVTFRSNGTFTAVNSDGRDNGNYTYSNNKLDMGEGVIYTVSISGQNAEIKWTDIEEGYPATYYVKLKKEADEKEEDKPVNQPGSFDGKGKWFNSDGNSSGAHYAPDEVSTEIQFNGSTGVITKKTEKSIYKTANVGDVVVRNMQRVSGHIFSCEAMHPQTGEWRYQSQVVYTPYYNEMITINIKNDGELFFAAPNFFLVK